MTSVAILDYGSGNLHSAARAFANAGADVAVTADLAELRRMDALVVPGVGAFAACMDGLRAAVCAAWEAADQGAQLSEATVPVFAIEA